MKRFALCAVSLFCLTCVGLQASDRPDWSWTSSSNRVSSSHHLKYKLIGDFTLVGFARFHSVILSDNNVYKPEKEYRRIVDDWNLQDTIRVLQTKHKHLVLLINLRTGESVKAKRHEVRK